MKEIIGCVSWGRKALTTFPHRILKIVMEKSIL
jgi:hypothetical protein